MEPFLSGHTPSVELSHHFKHTSARLLAKCEFTNQSMSLKDRMVRHVLQKASSEGGLRLGSTIVTASSGNTGTSLAMYGMTLGYKPIIFTSKFCSQEKILSMNAFGAEVVVKDHDTYTQEAAAFATYNNYFYLNQYDDPANPESYYRSLGPEIWEMTAGRITHFVMTGSTCGCISGTSRFLKEMNANILTILVDPLASRLHDLFYGVQQISDVQQGIPTILEGTGKSFLPGCLDTSVIDRVIRVSDGEAVRMCHRLAKMDGLLVGGSSGLNLAGVLYLEDDLDENSLVVTILCDSGFKYLSKIYNNSYLSGHGIMSFL